MMQELYCIPHRVGPLPVFGLGWAFIVWLLIAMVLIVGSLRGKGWNQDTTSTLSVAVVIAFLIAYVLPFLEVPDPAAMVGGADPRGLPIRGYGVMLLCGIVAGVIAASFRARQMGLDPEHIHSLAFWMFVTGIAGARMFFVVQYWSDFKQPTIPATVFEILKFTEGGLVVYGALTGAMLACLFFCRHRKLPVLAIGDIIAPAMLIGLAFGRIGCLANGCCYGGVCENQLPSLVFPQLSPPYFDQLESGQLLGLKLREVDPGKEQGRWNVDRVVEGTIPHTAGVCVGDKVIASDDSKRDGRGPIRVYGGLARAIATGDERSILVRVATEDGKAAFWTLPDLPQKSLPTHPAQIYSSISALLLFSVAWFAFPFLNKDGASLAFVLTLYPIIRFLMELVRVDEPGQLASLTIAQLVSIGILTAALGLWAYLFTRSSGRALLTQPAV